MFIPLRIGLREIREINLSPLSENNEEKKFGKFYFISLCERGISFHM